ncbi:hypothetical protein SSX86_006748 [Deinandra increscens subsp. villosa]|uniref:Uncharacterized protein n=1 Tax=Deinandra increscens subsp. villosa TaxID=3103831 RepID=A0AAP0DGN0_9ASTR
MMLDSVLMLHSARLDAQQLQIQQLQSDVAEIRKAIEKDREEERDFRNFVLNWMHQQDSRAAAKSSSPVGPYQRSRAPNSVSASLIAQLEESVSRSEARSISSQVVSCKVEQQTIMNLVSPDLGLRGEESVPTAPVLSPSLSLAETTKGVESSVTSVHVSSPTAFLFSDLGPYCLAAKEGKSKCSGVNLDDVSNTSVVELVGELSNLQNNKATLLSETILVLCREQAQLQDTYMLQGVFMRGIGSSIHVVFKQLATRFVDFNDRLPHVPPKLFVLDRDPQPPDLYIPHASHVVAFIAGSFHIPSRQSWVVHGQCRPPEDALVEVSTLIWNPLANFSLVDKTVLKGEVVIGIMFKY